jgi:hypothetical protein
MKQFYLILVGVLFNVYLTEAQTVKGVLVSSDTELPVIGADIMLEGTGFNAASNASGRFSIFDVVAGDYQMVISLNDKELYRQPFIATGKDMFLGDVKVANSIQSESSSEITVVELSDITQDTNEDDADYGTILSSGRDDFLSTAAFTFGSLRFNLRGLSSDFGSVYMNGVPMNELENGALYYGQWGGLNDVLRNVHRNHGLVASDYGIGGFLGNTDINVRASDQRKQTRIQYATSNRSYTNRLMLTHSSGLNKSGFAYTASLSRRWAQEGYTPGSFYDAYSYFLGLEKQFGGANSLHFTIMGSPSKRGKSGATLPEIAQITGDKYYNPYWGYQEGEKRNSRVGQSNQPIGILGFDWNISPKTTLKTAVSFQSGRNGGTALQWVNGTNPAGDYHADLPSRIEDEDQRAAFIANLPDDYFQVQWSQFYAANAGNVQTIENVDGIEGNNVSGKRANYLIEDRRYDATEMTFNTTLNHDLTEHLTLNAGANYRTYDGHSFTEVNDLLGADFFFDIDRFADTFTNPGSEQSDLNRPNRLVKEGDIFGYDYNSKLSKAAGWAQLQYRKGAIELFTGGELSSSSLQRIGNMKNGFYPENSFGESEKRTYSNYTGKVGATYKLSGRQYFSANGMIGTRAPYFRDAFVNPQVNDQFVPNLDNVDQKSAELIYSYRSPGFSFKTTAYFADINNDTEVYFFFSERASADDNNGSFGSFNNTNIDRRHVGIESAVSYKINSSFSTKVVAALGQYIYDSRWIQYAQAEVQPGFFRDGITVYSDGFYVESSPQTATSFELKYDSPNFWFATMSVNYIGNRYLDFSPDRRLDFTFSNLDNGSQEIIDATRQTKVDDAITVDLFAYKSYKIKDYFLIFTASVSNLFSADITTGGYEQLRFSAEEGPDFFENKLYQGYGRNYFLGVAIRI